METIVACQTCGLVQRVDRLPEAWGAYCARCGFRLVNRLPNSRVRTFVFSLAALILYFPANIYPIVTAEYHGMHSETTILQGIRSLFHNQEYAIGILVCFTSVISPIVKIVGMLLITVTLGWPRWKTFRTWAYEIIRIIDPWNMLEVYLLAIAVAMIEMGRIASVHPGRGVFSFTCVVALTLLAALSFDPRLIWDAPEEPNPHG
jgi:paraquat-inducible protein A